ncbi:unnamed protein product, partial [Hapterophycus canaliculatus]
AEVRGVYVWGNHSPTMWPDVSTAEVKIGQGWVLVERALQMQSEKASATRKASAVSLDNVKLNVDSVGNKVIEARGKSSALSAANAIANHLKDWLSCSTSTENRVSMGVHTDGNPYGVPDDLFCSFPVECGDGTCTGSDGIT